MSSALIGHTGFIGKIIQGLHSFDSYINNGRLVSLWDQELDLVVCAAPTGNRLIVKQYPDADIENVFNIIKDLSYIRIKKFILISTIDCLAQPNTPYAINRRLLEAWVKDNVESYTIIRLGTLVHPDITKNVLYDLKNQQWLDSICPDTTIQYSDMSKFKLDFDQSEVNFFSRPIANSEIIKRYCPTLKVAGQNQATYNIQPCMFSQEQAFTAIENYFNEQPLHLW